jgi:transposase-like protein
MLNQTEAKKLLIVGRRKFSEAEKDAALKYFIDNECTLEYAAEQHGMSTQTLSIHRQKTMEKHGLAEAKSKPKKKAKAA